MTATLTFGLSRSTLLKIRGVFAQHPAIDSAVVYGSRAMGNYKPGSDIDLSLHGAALTINDLIAVTEGLEELLLP